MNKISMDALNAGWNIGFGTRVATRHDDLALLVAAKSEQLVEVEAPAATEVPSNGFTRMFDRVAAVFALFSYRTA